MMNAHKIKVLFVAVVALSLLAGFVFMISRYVSLDYNASSARGAIQHGDCNKSGKVDAGDYNSIQFEIMDGDGNLAIDARDGTFIGDPIGCDANADNIIDAGDLSCVSLLMFGKPCSSNPAGEVPWKRLSKDVGRFS